MLNAFCLSPPLLVASKDGMDQSKWAIPRVRHGRLTKRIAKHDRPKTKLQGCWLHGIVLCMFVLDVRQGGDGSMVCECFSRALDKMKEACDQRGKPYPKRIILWELWCCTWKVCCFSQKFLLQDHCVCEMYGKVCSELACNQTIELHVR